MDNKPITILGINPGARYLGISVFQGPELIDWAIKVTKGEWSEERMKKIMRTITSFIEQYRPEAIAIKKLHPARSSEELKRLVLSIKTLAESKGIMVCEYPLKYLEAVLLPSRKINRMRLAEIMAEKYPILFPELNKETENLNQYYIRMFEAAALAHVCHVLLVKQKEGC